MYYNLKESGERIRQLRIHSKLTQEMLAKELSIDRSLLSHIESGKRGCSVDLFVRFSDFFDVSLDFLILGKNQLANDRSVLKMDITELISRLEAFKTTL